MKLLFIFNIFDPKFYFQTMHYFQRRYMHSSSSDKLNWRDGLVKRLGLRSLQDDGKGFSNRDITISYLYMNAPLNFFNELSMSKR